MFRDSSVGRASDC